MKGVSPNINPTGSKVR